MHRGRARRRGRGRFRISEFGLKSKNRSSKVHRKGYARLIGTVLDNLGTVLQETNRFVAAEPLHKRALALKKQAFGPNHPNMAPTLNNLASVLRHTNRQSNAEPLYREVLRIGKRPFIRVIPGSRWPLTTWQSYSITPTAWRKPNHFRAVLS